MQSKLGLGALYQLRCAAISLVKMSTRFLLFSALPLVARAHLKWADFGKCPDPALSSNPNVVGVCPLDFTIIGKEIEAIHESTVAPTGICLDLAQNLYITRHRNLENETNTLAITTSVCSIYPPSISSPSPQDSKHLPRHSRTSTGRKHSRST